MEPSTARNVKVLQTNEANDKKVGHFIIKDTEHIFNKHHEGNSEKIALAFFFCSVEKDKQISLEQMGKAKNGKEMMKIHTFSVDSHDSDNGIFHVKKIFSECGENLK